MIPQAGLNALAECLDGLIDPDRALSMVPAIARMIAATTIRATEQGIDTGDQGKGTRPAGRVRDQRSRACHEAAVLAGPGENGPAHVP
jgi:hypothetical protein